MSGTNRWEPLHRLSTTYALAVAFLGSAVVNSFIKAALGIFRHPSLPWWGELCVAGCLSVVIFLLLRKTQQTAPDPLPGVTGRVSDPSNPTEHPLPAVQAASQDAVQAEALGEIVTPSATSAAATETGEPLSFPGTATVLTSRVPVGNFVNHSNTIRIEVRAIRRHQGSEVGEREHGAVLYVDSGGGLIYGGRRCVEISTNCYYLPVTTFPNKEPYSIYFCHFSDDYATLLATHLEHINPISGIITLKTVHMTAYKKL
jgi:hypothetical protein